ncbi:MAG: rod shape-determining protein RodA [Opitutales bacterium]
MPSSGGISAVRSTVFDKQYQRFFKRESVLNFDWVSPLCMLILLVVGCFFIYSAQFSYGGGSWKRQIFWVFFGFSVYSVIALTDYRILLSKAHWIFIGGIVLLALVKTPLGVTEMGARRWINLGITNYQPSEAAKLATLVMVSSILSRSKFQGIRNSLKVLAKTGLVVCIPAALILEQPDLGSTLVIPPMVFSLLYVSNLSQRFFVGTFAACLILVSIVGFDIYRYHNFLSEKGITADVKLEEGERYEDQSWFPLHDYQRNRLLAFFAPDLADPRGVDITYNARQSFITVGTGGLFGKGWLEGTQARLGYLPKSVAHNDFIFSVIGEEAGFLGGLGILALFGILIANGFRVASVARDHFGMLLCVGVSVLFLVHLFINVGMTVGLAPITGLPLPFLSYGGSFVLSCCVLQGIIQSVYRHRRDYT